ncbi:MAG: glutamine ABC transporter ATP-binding protein [Clostridiales bacterium 43-6]|nr:MAG: glutamine ABC transporter ATP-binding protein [Clostridiales bacterium 43-6]
MSILDVKNIKKSFDQLAVLKDISFSVNEGEVVAIIGPSGSGKSTLLRCITQLERADEGEITLCGLEMCKSVNSKSVYSSHEVLHKIQLSCGLVFQNFHLFPHYSVLKNVMDAQIHVLKQSKPKAKQIALDFLDKMGLSDKADAYPCQLSGGQQQRVSIARALALNPKILFFDEPTSALDPELTGEILKVIKELAKENMTMVIVTHEMSFARDVADKVIFMDDGYIVEEGDPREVINNPKSERTKQFLKRFSGEE